MPLQPEPPTGVGQTALGIGRQPEETHTAAPLVALGIMYALLTVASVAALVLLRQDWSISGMSGLNPFGPPETARRFFVANVDAVRVGGFFCFLSAVPLAIYTAIVAARLQCRGVRNAGVYIAFAGGMAASGGLGAAGLLLWVLSIRETNASIPLTHALHVLAILSGGVGFAVGQGLMAAGVSVAARAARLLPSWIVALGVFIAVTGALSAFGMLSEVMTIPVPITRVAGFVWLIAAGTHLSRRPAS